GTNRLPHPGNVFGWNVGPHEPSLSRSGDKRVYADSILSVINCQGSHQGRDGSFGGRVGSCSTGRESDKGSRRRGANDRTPTARSQHGTHRVFAGEVDTVEVSRQA